MNRKAVLLLKIILPVVVIVLAVFGARILASMQTPPETIVTPMRPPVVRVQTITLEDHRFLVESQGTVRPRTESRVVPAVAGRVLWVSPDFVSGGFLEAGAPMLRIDPYDYEQALVRAAAEVAGAKLRLAQEQAEADLARAEWEELGEGPPPDLTARVPHLENAHASVAAAEANLVRAQHDLDRTEIKSPYAGRVRDKDVDVGQFVSPGNHLGTIYAIDYAEIRLPLPDKDLAYLSNMPLVYRGQRRTQGPEVVLRAEFAGGSHQWIGRLVRTEGEIDAASRMVHAVAQVRDPYGRGDDPDRPPLAVGMYVTAEILGDIAEQVAIIPRAALRGDDRVWVLDADNRLRFRTVKVLRLHRGEAVVGSGLASGERIILSSLDFVIEGMSVQPSEGTASS